MLVGIRSQLKAGGFAFVTLPRSCVDHSFTMNEGSFADALAAGLHRLFYKAGGEKAVDLKMATSEAEQQKMGEANTAEASAAAVAARIE